MSRVSLRTLILMLELLVAVVALQYLTMAKPVQADTLWVATDFVAPPSAPACEVNEPLGP
jgi:hypothetical protein